MKKYALLFLFVCLLWSTAALAQSDIKVQGVVMKFDTAGKTIDLKEVGGNNITLTVTPATEFELKSKASGFPDQKVDFSALQIDDWIKVEYVPSGKAFVAEEIDIYR